jgi:3-oxoacyl-[acyl-carrier protein] reductase
VARDQAPFAAHRSSGASPPARRALVTGGSRGVGAAVTRALAARGCSVAIHCRQEVRAASSLAASLPGAGHCIVMGDLAEPDEVSRVVATAIDGLGGIDILVNNAGVCIEHSIMDDSFDAWQAVWRRTIDVNLYGLANVTWCVVAHLLDRPEGPTGTRIINVGSRGAYRGEPSAVSYAASKAAVHALTQSLAVALGGHRISVSAVAPGFVATDLAKEVLAGPRGDEIRSQSPFCRVGTPDEIAGAVAWLASPEAEWASGAVLDLNGASHVR